MKAIIIGLFLIVNLSFSQNNGTVSYYITKRDSCKLLKNVAGGTQQKVQICETLRGMIKLNTDGTVGFDVYQITENGSKTKDNNSSVQQSCINSTTDLNSTGDTFIINLPKRKTIGDTNYVQYLKFTAVNYGIPTINLRFRGKDNNGRNVVGSSLGLAFNAGFSRGFVQITSKRLVHYYLNFGAFVGASSAELNSTSVTTAETWVSTNKFTNPTVAYGPSFTIGRNNLGLVITYGWEKMLGADSERWIFNNKPWIGVGITASLGYF